jgi:hypothetical protein
MWERQYIKTRQARGQKQDVAESSSASCSTRHCNSHVSYRPALEQVAAELVCDALISKLAVALSVYHLPTGWMTEGSEFESL